MPASTWPTGCSRNSHGRHHTEVSASASQCPEEIRIFVVIAADEPAIGKNNLGLKDYFQCQTITRSQRTITTTQREADHANGSRIAGRRN